MQTINSKVGSLPELAKQSLEQEERQPFNVKVMSLLNRM